MRISFKLLAVVIATLCIAIITKSTQAQTYSGRATGLKATVITNGIPGAAVLVSDTGPLPGSGGSITASSASASVAGVLTSGSLTASTSGSGITSQSTAIVNTLDVNITGISTDLRVRADTIGSNTSCTCATQACSGGAIVANLRIGQTGGGTVIPVTGAVNQTVTLTSGTQTVTIVINEQILSPGSTTVNGLHITTTDSVTGTTLDIVVASSHSDIDCSLIPTAAGATISGRVLSASGRPVSGARVTFLDQNGEILAAVTNPFGYYSRSDVPVGETYFVEVNHKRFVFEPRIISPQDNVTGFDFISAPE